MLGQLLELKSPGPLFQGRPQLDLLCPKEGKPRDVCNNNDLQSLDHAIIARNGVT